MFVCKHWRKPAILLCLFDEIMTNDVKIIVRERASSRTCASFNFSEEEPIPSFYRTVKSPSLMVTIPGNLLLRINLKDLSKVTILIFKSVERVTKKTKKDTLLLEGHFP